MPYKLTEDQNKMDINTTYYINTANINYQFI